MSSHCFWTVVQFGLSMAIISYSHLTLNPAGAEGAQYLPTLPPSLHLLSITLPPDYLTPLECAGVQLLLWEGQNLFCKQSLLPDLGIHGERSVFRAPSLAAGRWLRVCPEPWKDEGLCSQPSVTWSSQAADILPLVPWNLLWAGWHSINVFKPISFKGEIGSGYFPS